MTTTRYLIGGGWGEGASTRARVSGLSRVHVVRGGEVRAYGSGESFDGEPGT
ncbi:hypothetical protein [Actinacidiphila soli]|uniref:hypothetical protein n=1 Tax=Actinacidiphila soli TaxID=2487275 RepID=UPI0013E37CD7|nr:hypothetical protein [Actinacidiphila soli]